MIVMVQTDPDGQFTVVIADSVPRDTLGVEIRGAMHVFGEDDAPHGHTHSFQQCSRSCVKHAEEAGFEISQPSRPLPYSPLHVQLVQPKSSLFPR